MKRFIFFLFALFISRPVFAIDFLVTRDSDSTFEEGEFRVVLQYACDKPGDDTIRFAPTRLSEIRIRLKTPLVIPPDCRGSVTVIGSDEADTLLDGSSLSQDGKSAGDNCTLHIYSENHTVKNVSFVNNLGGAGVCLFGRKNSVQESRFGIGLSGANEPNRYGIVVSNVFARERPGMDGGENRIASNRIVSNRTHGIYLKGDRITVEANEIIKNGGAGIVISENSLQITVGGSDFIKNRNRIQYNSGGGVIIMKPLKGENNTGHMISHNVLSQNEGKPADLDLAGDGLTPNDFGDEDEGPNRLINYVHHFQAFPLVGTDRYWGWGLDLHGTRIELYGVSQEDLSRRKSHGGGDVWKADALIDDWGFEIFPGVLKTGDRTTFLTFDAVGNTSEFALTLPVGKDTDLDGIVDNLESGQGTPPSGGSSLNAADSDGDGLPDPVEDKNRNGVWDKSLGETAAYKADSDGDGLSDWTETHGDGIYHVSADTDPLKLDTDGDGLVDGLEDSDGNGVWDAHLGETSPLFFDSDGDGFVDTIDTCPAIFNPGQERWYCE